MSNSKNLILSRIRAANASRQDFWHNLPDFSSAIYKPIMPNKLECFKAEMEAVSGLCTLVKTEADAYKSLYKWLKDIHVEQVYCRDKSIQILLENASIKNTDRGSDFEKMQAAVTTCELLVARTASVVVSAANESGRQLNFYPPIHIVIAKSSQLVDYPEDALNALTQKYGSALPSMISLISGPSRTADIEKTLVLGAHGPKVLHVYIYE